MYTQVFPKANAASDLVYSCGGLLAAAAVLYGSSGALQKYTNTANISVFIHVCANWTTGQLPVGTWKGILKVHLPTPIKTVENLSNFFLRMGSLGKRWYSSVKYPKVSILPLTLT